MSNDIIYISKHTMSNVKLWINEKKSLDIKNKKQLAIEKINYLEAKSNNLIKELTKVRNEIYQIKSEIKHFRKNNQEHQLTYESVQNTASLYPNKIYILTREEIEQRISNIKKKSNNVDHEKMVVNKLEKEINKINDANIIFLNIEKGELNNHINFGELPDVLIDIGPLFY